MARYKQKCMLCRKNFALITSYRQKPICMQCQMNAFEEVKDLFYKELFDIDMKLYEEVPYLRDVRVKYHRFGSLTENQIKAFRKIVNDHEKVRAV